MLKSFLDLIDLKKLLRHDLIKSLNEIIFSIKNIRTKSASY